MKNTHDLLVGTLSIGIPSSSPDINSRWIVAIFISGYIEV